ncbi:uncharacterized protein LOC119597758 isoform X2 [Penaeus monodon]|uniref:uncharacterized protein LOC119597758 isoform X1 n=1 Tax=Penaeus monodon TaxID=6687 RepID=UPI0018A70272|nr:uncharacterized protein LOC119597758 isoform X1 [Penaeus monodon]XP_037803315.1 uncharacterized protein LOC119597758 isoform X2 [Penaeus monodon]
MVKMALLLCLAAWCLALGAAAPHNPQPPLQAWSRDSPSEDPLVPSFAQDDRVEPLVRERRQTAGLNAESLALRHDNPVGEPFHGTHVNVDEGTNSLHYGGGVGAVLGKSPDGRHSLGAATYGQQSVFGGDKLSFTHPNLGVGVGYRYNGDKTSVALGAHAQSFGGGVSEKGASLNLEHRLNDRHSLFGGISRSNTDYSGLFSRTDTDAKLGYRYNINDRTSLSLTGTHSNSDLGPFGSRSGQTFRLGFGSNF